MDAPRRRVKVPGYAASGKPIPGAGIKFETCAAQRSSAACGVPVTLIYAADSAKAPALMIENFFNHGQLHAKRSKAGCRGPP